MSTAVVSFDPSELESKVAVVVQDAKALKITNQVEYETAGRFVLEYVNPVLKEIDKTFDELIDTTNRAHKEAVAQKKRHATPMLEAKAIAIDKCRDYQNKQARIEAAKQRKAEEAARKREEKERLKEAEAAQKAGVSEEEVDAILETPMQTAPVKVTPTITRVKGLVREKRFSAQVTNKLVLVRYIAQNPQFLHLLEPHMPSLNTLATSLGERMQIPGVRAGRF